MKHDDDLALVSQLLDGDRLAFDAFYATYFGRVHRFCARRVDDDEACKDIVQLTFIRAMRYLDGYRGEASLHTWICQICRNEIHTWFKRPGNRQDILVSIDERPGVRVAIESLGATLVETSSEEASTELKDLVQTALDCLKDDYGKALEWKYIEGCSVREIAARLNTGVVAAQSLLAHARADFRAVFSDLEQEANSVG